MNETAHALGASATFWELIERRAALTPDRPVLVQDDRSLTFGELRERCERVAAGLYGLGVRPGSVVAWQLPTRLETALLSFALTRIGAVQTPVIPFYRDREVGFALRESKAGFFAVPGTWRGFDHTAMAHRLAAELDRPPLIFEAYDQLPDADPAVLPAPPTDGTAVRWIYWTSGTTSDPKGVLHTDRSLIAGGSCLAHALHLSADDIGSMAFPFAHIAGPDYTVMLLLYGFPAVLFEQFAMPGALDAYRRHEVTVAGGSTAFYSMFLTEQRKDPTARVVPTLRLLAGGGAPKPPEIYHAVVREMGVQLTHGYGMTEVPMITMGAPDDTVEHLAETEGRPPEGMEIRITDEDGKPLPYGTDGEVRLRGEAVCQGYLDAAATRDAFDGDGFLITGDVGHLRRSGHLVLTEQAQGRHHPQGREHLRQGDRGPPPPPPRRGRRGRDRPAGHGTRGTRLRGRRAAGRGRDADTGGARRVSAHGGARGAQAAGAAGGGGRAAAQRDVAQGAQVQAARAVLLIRAHGAHPWTAGTRAHGHTGGAGWGPGEEATHPARSVTRCGPIRRKSPTRPVRSP